MTAACRTQSSLLFSGPAFTVVDRRCVPTWDGTGPEETCETPCIAFVRRGVFRRHLGSETTVVDPSTVLFFNPHEPYRVSHPRAVGDRCTVIALDRTALEQLAESVRPLAGWDAGRPFRAGHAYVATRSLLKLRAVTHPVRLDDDLETEETVAEVVADVVAGPAGLTNPRSLPRPALRRRAVERVREMAATSVGQRLSLRTCSEATGYSPFYLLRVFREETGLPIRRYVNRLRLLHGLDRLDPSCSLSRLAHELGFSSHSHFSRAFAAEFGLPPARVRSARPGPRAAQRSART